MAPTSNSKGGKSTIKGMKALIEQFCAVTGSDEDIARRMIETCNGNIEMAVNMHIESQSDVVQEVESSVAITSPATPHIASPAPESAETVRAPIPQTKGILVEEGYSYGFRGRRRAAHSVFDGFRDFQAETRRQEEELINGPSISSKKRKTLEDLFRPPLDIIHKGTFETAKDSGRSSNRWLMVNIQNSQEFSCQILNRDLWSSSVVKSIVCEHFVFWQVYHDSEEGKRYCQFYKVNEFPYISILDPRTGENMNVWNKIDSLSFCDLVTEFLSSHKTLSGNSTSPPTKKVKHDIVDASEDSQLEAALLASLKENRPQENNIELSSDDEIETFDSDEEIDVVDKNDESTCNEDNNSDLCISSWEDYIGNKNDPKSRLIFRYPNGRRGELTLPSSSQLKAVILFVHSEGFCEDRHELVTNFPKRNLSNMDSKSTLDNIGLLHQETIFVQLKNLSSDDDTNKDPR